MYAELHLGHDKAAKVSSNQLVQCTPNPQHCGGTGGCEGATPELAFEYIKHAGIVAEEDENYRSQHSPCPQAVKNTKSLYKIGGWKTLEINKLKPLLIQLAHHGPATV